MRRLSFKLNLLELSYSGFWYCGACQRVTERVEHDDGRQADCLWCRSSKRLRYCAPVFTNYQTQGTYEK